MIRVTVRGGETYSHPEKNAGWSVDQQNPMLLHVFAPRAVLRAVGGNPAAAKQDVDLLATYIVPNVIRVEKDEEA